MSYYDEEYIQDCDDAYLNDYRYDEDLNEDDVCCPYCGNDMVESIGNGIFICYGCNAQFDIDEADIAYIPVRNYRPRTVTRRPVYKAPLQQLDEIPVAGCAALSMISIIAFILIIIFVIV